MNDELVLNCPGRTGDNGRYEPGCGLVTAVIASRRIAITPGRSRMMEVLVCPDCGQRLLPTSLELQRTRRRKRAK